MKIFLVAGKARSGKTEVAKLIREYYDGLEKKSVITEYSKYIKLFAREMAGWDMESEPKPRNFLQRMGSFIREDLQMPHFFTDRMKEDILVYEKFYEQVIISDVRLIEEIEDMRHAYDEVYVIQVLNRTRPGDITEKEMNHITETALDDYNQFDKILVNDDIEKVKEELFDYLGGLE